MFSRMAEKLPPVIPATYRPSNKAIEMLGSRVNVMGRTIIMPVLIVMPGIIPTIRPSNTPIAVAIRLDNWIAWANPRAASSIILHYIHGAVGNKIVKA